MTASVDARQVAELEELYGREIPCGGNWATGRPCPDSAAAVVVRSNVGKCRHPPVAQDFKCLRCYTDWLTAAIEAATYGRPACASCGTEFTTAILRRMYVPL